MKPPFSLPHSELMDALSAFKGTFKTIALFSAIINLLMLAANSGPSWTRIPWQPGQ